MNKQVLILMSPNGDWEGLFIDGILIDEGHKLGEGNSRTFLLEKAEEHNFSSKDVREITITDEDENYLNKYGAFPEKIEILKGSYE